MGISPEGGQQEEIRFGVSVWFCLSFGPELAEHYHQNGRRPRLRRVRLGTGWPGRLQLHPPLLRAAAGLQQRSWRLQFREGRAKPGLRSVRFCSAAISLDVTGLGLGSGRSSSFNFTAKGPKLQEGKREGRKCAKDAGKRSLLSPAALSLRGPGDYITQHAPG